MTITERRIPTPEDIRAYATSHSNWGRWGADDQRGAVNLITPEKRIEAARLVRSGRSVSLSRPLGPIVGRPNSAVHIVWGGGDETEGGGGDWIGTYVHGHAYTHVDALSHFIGPRGAWNGKRPDELFWHGSARSPLWGAVDEWKEGITTRGVLLDVPRYRAEPFVTLDRPVHGWELEAVARAEGVESRPGDALIVHCGREGYEATHPPYGSPPRPGLHGSCLEFLREVDCAVLVWDMSEHRPVGPAVRRSELVIHSYAIPEFGIAIVDNALIGPLADACAAERRYEFLFTLAPLRISDGTGSPANPLAIF